MAASWGGNVVSRWIAPTLRLIEVVLHNVPQTVIRFTRKIKELERAVQKSNKRSKGGDSES